MCIRDSGSPVCTYPSIPASSCSAAYSPPMYICRPSFPKYARTERFDVSRLASNRKRGFGPTSIARTSISTRRRLLPRRRPVFCGGSSKTTRFLIPRGGGILSRSSSMAHANSPVISVSSAVLSDPQSSLRYAKPTSRWHFRTNACRNSGALAAGLPSIGFHNRRLIRSWLKRVGNDSARVGKCLALGPVNALHGLEQVGSVFLVYSLISLEVH